MTLAKYNTKNGSPNDRRKRRLEELRAKKNDTTEEYSMRSDDELDFLEDEDREGYVRILIAMAGADGTLVREETAAIEAAMGRACLLYTSPSPRD